MWSKVRSTFRPREGNDGDPLPDPFCADATTYYAQQAPPTPPSGSHSRTASREEDTIWCLRTQLALQQELCAQFEIDLNARNDFVQALTIRLEASEKEKDKHKSVVQSWKKKVAEMEIMCRHLGEEVDNSRQDRVERRIMDKASEEALRQLQRHISQLEREKNDIEGERDNLLSELSMLRLHIQKLQNDSAIKEVTIVQLNKQLDRDKEDIDGLNIALESKQQELRLEKRKHGAQPPPKPGSNYAIPSIPSTSATSSRTPVAVLAPSLL